MVALRSSKIADWKALAFVETPWETINNGWIFPYFALGILTVLNSCWYWLEIDGMVGKCWQYGRYSNGGQMVQVHKPVDLVPDTQSAWKVFSETT